VQEELAVWMLVAQNPESFAYAGQRGYNVFTMLYGYDLESLRERILRYRTARREAGHDPDGGVVTLMLHTFLGASLQEVERAVEKPFKEYISSSMGAHLAARASEAGAAVQSREEQAQILDYAYQRYLRTGALFGSVQDAERTVEHAKQVGVDEIACVLDFGVKRAAVESSLTYLKALVAGCRGRS
jgi:natural product biosynthesis luciferase-like monooxygenase protein